MLDEACVYRVGGATGVLSRTSKALVEAGLDKGVTQNFKVQVVNQKIQRLVIYLPDRWDRLCEHFADEMARADAPRC
ncbi:MAG: hypothetical protein KY469_22655 [Actinobacteria bacterium]|nr:hypothetical protein [Actinomycetota bacterium]